jgi:hypothetical protein
MNRKTILVFPCGSEVGLEINRSLRYSRHIKLIGGNSIEDHGRLVFKNYIGSIPFISDPIFNCYVRKLVEEKEIDAIYPAMDSVIALLTEDRDTLGCKIISSPVETVRICSSKKMTYDVLKDILLTPVVYETIEDIDFFPVFMKPEIGYGTRGARKINNIDQARCHLEEYPGCVILEYLPSREFTVDCFTDRRGRLLFAGPRQRRRMVNGISVNTISVQEDLEPFLMLAEKINERLTFRGAWFFQVKENRDGRLVLLETAARLGGSSSLYRSLGVNFALLSIFDAFEEDVSICPNPFSIEMDRALNNRYRISLDFDTVYVDCDDTLIIDNALNTNLIKLLYQFINEKKKLVLLTKHIKNINQTLREYRITDLFDEVVQMDMMEKKADYVKSNKAVFIDDSYSERKEVFEQRGVPVFSPDACECLVDD